jgi:hypothetical protein
MVFAGLLLGSSLLPHCRGVEQPDRERKPDRRSVFPATHRPQRRSLLRSSIFWSAFDLVGMMVRCPFCRDGIVFLPVFIAIASLRALS